ncbi:TrbI/VirB10 family protein [Serratia fonticola]|jgi:type IV secretion system protein VirB10
MQVNDALLPEESNAPPVNNEGVNEPPKFEAKGDFDTRRVRRKKNFDNKAWKVIGVMVLFWVVVVVGIIWFAVSKMGENSTRVDESKVQADPAMASRKAKDDGMSRMMEKYNDSPVEQPALPPKTAGGSAKAPTSAASQISRDESSSTPPVERQEEGLFISVNRFDSGGLSAGSNVSTGSGSGDDDPDIAKIRAYANAAPSEPGNETLRSNSGLAGFGAQRSELDSLTATSYPSTKAYRMPNPKYLLKRRTSFQCVLYNGVKTDHPGFITCHLTRPLYSADGSVILAEAGAELLGEQKVEVKAGQSSIFTSWTDLETAPGVRASLNGLGTDAMGRSGTDAFIDNHYGQRFGGAIMLSFIQDALQSAANATQKSSSNGYTVNNSEKNVEDMASKALENSINIPPTGYVLPGTVINVIVSQDIDFSPVFKTR